MTQANGANGTTSLLVWAVLITLAIGVAGAIGVIAFVPVEQMPIALTTIGGMFAPTLAGIMAVLQIRENNRKLALVDARTEKIEKITNGHTSMLEQRNDNLQDKLDVSQQHNRDILSVAVEAKEEKPLADDVQKIQRVKPDIGPSA